MQALDDALPEHVQSGRIRAAETYPHATDKTRASEPSWATPTTLPTQL